MLMADEQSTQQLIIELGRLHKRLDQLLMHCADLKHELTTLRTQHHDLTIEHDRLTRNNATARARVQAMVNQLRAMETPPATPE